MLRQITVCQSLFFCNYRPQMKFAKVMFLHLSVSHSVHRGEYLGRYPPGRYTHTLGRYTSQAGTPLGRYNLQAGTPLGADPGGPRGPPLTLDFEAPKLSIFGALFNFSTIFFASLCSAYYFFNVLLFHSSNWKIFQPHFAQHVISHLQVFVSHILDY